MKRYSMLRGEFRTIVPPWFFSFALCFLTLSSASGAPYPPDGLVTKWVQPDGTPLTLRVFGDEFYGRTTTEDGYTVVFSDTDNAYYFAEMEANGKSLVSSGIQAHQLPPHGLSKHLKEPKEVIAAIHAANVQKYAPDRAAKWKARKSAVNRQRLLDAGQAPAVTGSSRELSSSADLAAAAAPISGTTVGLMILVQFPDDPATVAVDPTNFPTTQAKMHRLSNELGYTDDGNTGSIRDYFSDQSGSRFSLQHVVTQIVTLPHPRDFYNYSNYPTNTTLMGLGTAGRLLVTDAIAQLKTRSFNFSTLTVDSTKSVIDTSLLFAGNDSGVWAKGLWPHQSYVPAINVGTAASPRYIYGYMAMNVADAAPLIGTMCHELGHLVLHYPDWYDVNSEDGASEGVGEFSLMGSGNWLNGGRTPAPLDMYLRDFSGWEVINDEPIHSLPHTADINDFGGLIAPSGFRMRKPGSSTEYFLIGTFGTNNKWAGSLPDQGMVIWHVDEAVLYNNNQQQMTPSQHYELSLEQADGQFHLEKGWNRGDNWDLFDPVKPFNDRTLPDAKWWDGAASGIWVKAATPPGQYSQSVKFDSPVIQFNSESYSANEGAGTVIITVNRTGVKKTAVSVHYATSNGTATAGSDYTAKSGTLSFAAEVTSATIRITVTNDTVYEGNENFVVTLSSPVAAVLNTPSSTQVTIPSDPTDIPPGCS